MQKSSLAKEINHVITAKRTLICRIIYLIFIVFFYLFHMCVHIYDNCVIIKPFFYSLIDVIFEVLEVFQRISFINIIRNSFKTNTKVWSYSPPLKILYNKDDQRPVEV